MNLTNAAISGVEMLIAFADRGHRTFFETDQFPWVRTLETNWGAIRAELDRLLQDRDRIPNFQDISPVQASLTEGEQWKTFFLYAYGREIPANCAQCPETLRLLQCISGMTTAMFSILAPGKHIPAHRGPYNGVLRYHLGLIVEGAPLACRIRVGQTVRRWREGKSLVFDDSHNHEAWNDSNCYRVVLFVDFVRPLRFPLSLVNRLAIWAISRSDLVQDGFKALRGKGERP